MSSVVFKGVVHGKIIELDREPGLPDGQAVTVTVQPTPVPAAGQVSTEELMRRTFGAWSQDAEALDKFLEETRQLRKLPRREVAE